jgi:hypothetical protein
LVDGPGVRRVLERDGGRLGERRSGALGGV